MTIDQTIFHKFDLNSLVTFLVVYQERGVSRAAKSLQVTQPAVSNVLSKLRTKFDDPLFIPCGRVVRPTHKADLIAEVLAPAMIIVQELIAQGALDKDAECALAQMKVEIFSLTGK
jgi:LysR family transcriptional activator for leuABCD operon/LysR family transcriptional activator of mexEF-oprN operon